MTMILRGLGGGSVNTVEGVANHRVVVDADAILIAPMTNPDMFEDMIKAKAVVTDKGGSLSHAAIVCSERGIPFVVGTKIATSSIPQGARLEVNPVAGTVTIL